MIIIEGTVRIDPERLTDARPAMERMIRASRAEAGCIEYAYSIDLLDPGLVRVNERWADRDSLKAHFETSHMAEWRMVWPSLGIRDRSLRLYEAEPESL